MAVPKSKISRSKTGKRRSQDRVKKDQLAVCQHTGRLHRRHHVTKEGTTHRGEKV